MAAPTPDAVARAHTLLGAAAATLDDVAVVELADKAATNYLAQLEKGSMEDAAAAALLEAVVLYDANRTTACTRAALSRAASAAAPGWDGAKNGTSPVANATAAASVEAAAAALMKVLDSA